MAIIQASGYLVITPMVMCIVKVVVLRCQLLRVPMCSNVCSPNALASFTITYGGNTFNESWGGIMWSGNYVCNMGVGFESIPHNLGKCWFPCVDNFTDKASYDVYVTVTNDKTAVCGGNLVDNVDNGDGTHTVHYNMPQEIATYHISFVAGDYVETLPTRSAPTSAALAR